MCQLIKTLGAAAESIKLDKWLRLDMHYSGTMRPQSSFSWDLQTYDVEFPDISIAIVLFSWVYANMSDLHSRFQFFMMKV